MKMKKLNREYYYYYYCTLTKEGPLRNVGPPPNLLRSKVYSNEHPPRAHARVYYLIMDCMLQTLGKTITNKNSVALGKF